MNKISLIVLLCFLALSMMASASDIKVYTIWLHDKYYHPGACIYLDGTDPCQNYRGFTTCLGKSDRDPSLIIKNVPPGKHVIFASAGFAYVYRGKQTVDVLPDRDLVVHVKLSHLKIGSMPTWPLNDTF
jgi:hypothetical protein